MNWKRKLERNWGRLGMRFKTEKLGDFLYIKGRIGWKGLKKEFNDELCYYIELETEDKSLSWKERKLKQIQELKENKSEVVLIAYSDKIANLTEMANDYKLIKDELWNRFNRGKEEQYWYYLEFYKIFCYNELIDKEHLKEYAILLEKLFK